MACRANDCTPSDARVPNPTPWQLTVLFSLAGRHLLEAAFGYRLPGPEVSGPNLHRFSKGVLACNDLQFDVCYLELAYLFPSRLYFLSGALELDLAVAAQVQSTRVLHLRRHQGPRPEDC